MSSVNQRSFTPYDWMMFHAVDPVDEEMVSLPYVVLNSCGNLERDLFALERFFLKKISHHMDFNEMKEWFTRQIIVFEIQDKIPIENRGLYNLVLREKVKFYRNVCYKHHFEDSNGPVEKSLGKLEPL